MEWKRSLLGIAFLGICTIGNSAHSRELRFCGKVTGDSLGWDFVGHTGNAGDAKFVFIPLSSDVARSLPDPNSGRTICVLGSAIKLTTSESRVLFAYQMD